MLLGFSAGGCSSSLVRGTATEEVLRIRLDYFVEELFFQLTLSIQGCFLFHQKRHAWRYLNLLEKLGLGVFLSASYVVVNFCHLR